IGTPNTTIQEIGYDYDKTSNITERDDVLNSFTETYGYDDLYRLTSANLGGTSKTWAFDEIGNITTNNGVTFIFCRIQGVRVISFESYDSSYFQFLCRSHYLTNCKFCRIQGVRVISFESYDSSYFQFLCRSHYLTNCKYIAAPFFSYLLVVRNLKSSNKKEFRNEKLG